MTDKSIKVTVEDDGVARLRLDRAEKHNALSADMIDRLADAAARLGSDPAVRVVIIEGAGQSFCAGGDLGWMQKQVASSAAERRIEAERLAEMLRRLDEVPKPLIASVGGNAFGGGVGLCAVCDVVIAAETALFGLTETRLGLIPATIGPYVLRRIDAGAARRYFTSSERFDAKEAQRIGLVSKCVALPGMKAAIASQISAYKRCAPGAVAAAKALARPSPVTKAEIAASIDALIAQWEGPEAKEGIAAFFDRRSPAWDSSDD